MPETESGKVLNLIAEIHGLILFINTIIAGLNVQRYYLKVNRKDLTGF